MSFVVDGDLSVAILFSKEETSSAFGPQITETWQGLHSAVLDKREELQLDARGASYEIRRDGDSPKWLLVIRWTQAESENDPSLPGYDPELPINIVWRLTNEFAEVDYRKMGGNQKILDDELSEAERKELNKYLEELLTGTTNPAPDWIGGKPSGTRISNVVQRFERGKSTTHVHHPVLTRDASFRKEANYRAKIDNINGLLTSDGVIALYPGEIPLQFRQRMPTNGLWKVTRNDWEIDITTGQGQETVMFTWDEWHDDNDTLTMTLPP